MEQEVRHAEMEFINGRWYRFSLLRKWDDSKPLAMFIGLNPSVANGEEDDPTIIRIRGFAQSNGYGGFYMVNCFPMVTPNPSELIADQMAKNDSVIYRLCENVKDVIFCWGAFKEPRKFGRGRFFKGMFPNALCFGKNANGSPKHPLYLKSTTPLIPYS